MMQKRGIAFFTGIVILMLVSAGTIFAQATVTKIAGKVEIKAPNSTIWSPAWVGMYVQAGSSIGTGFRSIAELNLDGSTLYVKQLTRLTLEEIARSQGVIRTNLYIQTGSMEAEVKRGTDYTHDYKVRSPVSTAAVRGTKIKYNGIRLVVTEGHATLFNLLGQPTSTFLGDSSVTGDGLSVLSPRMLKLLDSRIRFRLRNPFKTSTIKTTISTFNDAVVIFYPIFD